MWVFKTLELKDLSIKCVLSADVMLSLSKLILVFVGDCWIGNNSRSSLRYISLVVQCTANIKYWWLRSTPRVIEYYFVFVIDINMHCLNCTFYTPLVDLVSILCIFSSDVMSSCQFIFRTFWR